MNIDDGMMNVFGRHLLVIKILYFNTDFLTYNAGGSPLQILVVVT
jgi:hypothetical protein